MTGATVAIRLASRLIDSRLPFFGTRRADGGAEVGIAHGS
jgi:hypothetical protein